MAIKVTLEFDNLDEAIVSMGLLAESNETRKSPQKAKTTGEAETVAKTVEKTLPKEPSKKVQRLLQEYGLTEADVVGTGKNGNILEKDVQKVVKARQAAEAKAEGETALEPGPMTKEEKDRELDKCRAALKALNDAKGMQACIDLLKNEFKVNRVSDLHETRYAKFVKACEGALA